MYIEPDPDDRPRWPRPIPSESPRSTSQEQRAAAAAAAAAKRATAAAAAVKERAAQLAEVYAAFAGPEKKDSLAPADLEAFAKAENLDDVAITALYFHAKNIRYGLALGEGLKSSVRDFFRRKGIQPSDAVFEAVANSSMFGHIDTGALFLGLLAVFRRDERDNAERSLPLRIVRELDLNSVRVELLIARYRGVLPTTADFDSARTIRGSVAFDDLLTQAARIRESCSPNERVAARHLVAALLTSYHQKTEEGQSLQKAGFEPARVLEALRSNLRLYEKEDNAKQWTRLLQTLSSGKQWKPSRESTDDELCLGIEPYSHAIADTFSAASQEDDFVFALYAPWGRGKSTMIKRVAKILCGDPATRAPGRGYVQVPFSAWKYPTRPEVWVHLYQKISSVAHGDGFLQKLRIGFRLGLMEKGWLPLFASAVLLAVSRVQIDVATWFFHGLGILGLLVLGSFIWSASATGRRLARHFTLPDHSEKLGLQAVIGKDLKHLLKVWIEPEAPAVGSVRQANPAWDISRWWPGRAALILLVLVLWAALGLASWKTHRAIAAEATAVDAVQTVGARITEAGVKISDGDVSIVIPRTEEMKRVRAEEWEKGENARAVADWLLLAAGLAIAVFAIVIGQRPVRHRRVLLVVDDLDRCDPSQMLAVIESLRLFLEEAEMSRRLQVAMLLDRRIFARAIAGRGRTCLVLDTACPVSEARFVREQEEKLFVATLQLPALDRAAISEFAAKIVDREFRQQLQEKAKELEQARPDSATGGEGASNPEVVGELEGIKNQLDEVRPAIALTRAESSYNSDVTFSEEERKFLKAAFDGITPTHLTPRSLRAFVMKYQLIRLILKKSGTHFSSEEVIQCLASRLFENDPVPLPEGAVGAAVEMVAVV